MNFLITLLIAFIGGKLGLKLKIPAGAMIGALVLVAILNITTGMAYLPQEYKVLTQIVTGAFIGARISKSDILGLKEVVKPAILIVSCMAIMNFILGYILYRNSDMDITTALFSTAPGGMMDMTLIAHELKADSAKVVMFQLIRLISVIGLIPMILKSLIRFKEGENFLQEDKVIKNKKENNKKTLENTFLTLMIGFISGCLGMISGIPAGALSFSMLGVGAFNIILDKGYMSIGLRHIIQMLGGALIGSRIEISDVIGVKEMIPLVGIVVIGFTIMNLLIGTIVYKSTNFNIATSLFSSAPGGVADISIIASEMGADTPKVAVIQLVRLVSIVSFYPILIQIITKFFV